MIQFGIRRIDIGILKAMKPQDELITAMNAIADFIGITGELQPRFIQAVEMILRNKGINLVWDEKGKKFERQL